jgi:hypothetical protein
MSSATEVSATEVFVSRAVAWHWINTKSDHLPRQQSVFIG